MAWDEEMPLIIRVMINDNSATPVYSDDDLLQLITVAAKKVGTELTFPTSYEVDVVNVTISPDPTVGESKDDNYVNLVCTMAACIIDRGSASQAAGQAIRVKDGPSEVDLRDRFRAKLAQVEKGYCALYEDMKEEYIFGKNTTVVGAAIMSPIRVYLGDYEGYGRGCH